MDDIFFSPLCLPVCLAYFISVVRSIRIDFCHNRLHHPTVQVCPVGCLSEGLHSSVNSPVWKIKTACHFNLQTAAHGARKERGAVREREKEKKSDAI